MSRYYPNSQYLAETDWLFAHIDDEDLRIIDARFHMRAREDGTLERVSGHADYLAGHIPGAQFVDLHAGLTHPVDPTSITGPEAFAALMSSLGIGPHKTVVVYDDRGGIWAARLWWALRYYGHDRVKILNGGLGSWKTAGYGLQKKVVACPPARFVASVRPDLRVTRQEVLAAIDAPDTCIIDALPEPFYLGQAGISPRHRKGHVPGAYNLPAESHLDPQSLRMKSPEALRKLWQHLDIVPDRSVITYCGGGIFASFVLFVSALMGHEKVALYDASWMEWGADENLPVETGRRVPQQSIPAGDKNGAREAD